MTIDGISVFLDTGDIGEVRAHAGSACVQGVTTNPTLARAAHVADYRRFAEDVARAMAPRPVSVQVLADDPTEANREARRITSWGANIFAKVPVTNSCGEPLFDVARDLAQDGLNVNVTGVVSLEQAERVLEALAGCRSYYLSLFCGRVADVGLRAHDFAQQVVERVNESASRPKTIWAGVRSVLDVLEARAAGCDVVTLPPAIWAKIPLLGTDVEAHGLNALQAFRADSVAAGYTVDLDRDS